MTVTSIIPFQGACHQQYMDEDDRQGQRTIQILEMWIRRTIITLSWLVNHTDTGTGGRCCFTFMTLMDKIGLFVGHPVGSGGWTLATKL